MLDPLIETDLHATDQRAIPNSDSHNVDVLQVSRGSLQKPATSVSRGLVSLTSGPRQEQSGIPPRDQQTSTEKLAIPTQTYGRSPSVESHPYREASCPVRERHGIRSNTSTAVSGALRASVPSRLVPPPINSTEKDLDHFVLNSTVTYASLIHQSGSRDLNVTNLAYEWWKSLLPMFQDLEKYKRFLDSRGELAQATIDGIQNCLDGDFVDPRFRVTLIVALSRLARKSERFPKRFFLHDIAPLDGPFAQGHFGDIYKGIFEGKVVCIKKLTFNISDARSYRRALSREIMPWAQLSHENVLPFYGIFSLGDCCRFGIVSPFLEKGDVVNFLVESPDADRLFLIHGIATGMSYLHDNGIVHGDIKGQNILVANSDPPRAVVADFGFAIIADSQGLRSPHISSGCIKGGTAQFQAPELLNPPSTLSYPRTKASDVYAFSMTVYQIICGRVPFPNKHDLQVMNMVVSRRDRPGRPSGQVYRNRGLDDSMWDLMTKCWHQRATMRPNARQILRKLPKGSTFPTQCTQRWDDLSPPQFRKKQMQDS